MKRRSMMIAAVLAVGMLFRTVDMDVVAEGTVSGGDAVQEATVSGGDAVPLDDIATVSLQVPQKIEIVIDPWELDGRGQVYSEQYVIKNTGNVAGMLTLSGTVCGTGGKGGVDVRADVEGLHEGEEKALYVEMVFGNGDRAVLSPEGSVYEAWLEPEEELLVSFSGEANENAGDFWRESGAQVRVVYAWN